MGCEGVRCVQAGWGCLHGGWSSWEGRWGGYACLFASERTAQLQSERLGICGASKLVPQRLTG